MTKEPVYIWDEDTRKATCIIEDEQGRKFIGEAIAHEADIDFTSEKTGMTIAVSRAAVKYLQSVKRDVIKPQLAALNQLYYSMKHSKKFNPKSYENRMLQRQIQIKKDDLIEINREIQKHRDFLHQYINDKEVFYQLMRKKRGVQAPPDKNK